MNRTYYPFALIISLCLILALISVQNANLRKSIVQETKTEIGAILDEIDVLKINQLTASLSDKISALDALLQEYTEENGRLRQENEAYRDYIDGFWELMEEEYDFEGHQERYMEGHE